MVDSYALAISPQLQETRMALVYSPPPELGSPCPDFHLPTVDGGSVSRADLCESSVAAVMFICNHCPYVQAIEDRLIELGREFAGKSVRFLAISSNDPVAYPEDSFEKMKERSSLKGYPFPYAFDGSQSAARAFGAVCTPDFFVYDSEMRLAYRGRLDDSWKEPSKVTSRELKAAIDALIAGQRPAPEQKPSMGCSLKWKAS